MEVGVFTSGGRFLAQPASRNATYFYSANHPTCPDSDTHAIHTSEHTQLPFMNLLREILCKAKWTYPDQTTQFYFEDSVDPARRSGFYIMKVKGSLTEG